eukprot:Blabericola_migrator_1__6318@NODE_318_length_9886_cov_105_778796_g259_i0_p2_GENE_NODE_318_length_9886_cov_105_778796_g259_i0NODE_318_length_9886_cov_105_778796_g259_i0_p2_ORF_typecomplete_len706_score90_46Lipase_3/PF01764_25/4_3e10DUF818/PF05677_12/0_015Chlorophyllase2/PF12740_7/0_11Abhydrolase_6/PF12697_7/3_8e03Abhydrolase_6/PF12697_7/0_26Chlorophyllase/PF07224_11/0_25Ald_Xan_dh_C2/PF02738_18/0_19_NODE_318_length_9886_cov_105_778796_g259_i040606177
MHYLCWLLGLSWVHASKDLNVHLPPRLGISTLQGFCREGVPGALQRTVKALFQNDLNTRDAQALRQLYFNDKTRRAATAVDRRFGYDQLTENNTILAITKVVPILKDLLQMPEGKIGTQISSFSNKVCKLMDSEALVSRLSNGGTPYSCTLIDAIQAGLTCSPEEPNYPTECSDPKHPLSIPRFPEGMCQPPSRALQSVQNETLSKFHWMDPHLYMPLPLINMLKSYDHLLPDIIPSAVRDAELLTYLALYRAVRLVYQAAEVRPECLNTSALEVIPGWKTRFVINTVQPTKVGPLSEPLEPQSADPPQSTPLSRSFADFWDEGMKRALNVALRDMTYMLNDPVTMYRAFADVLTQFALPSFIERNARRTGINRLGQRRNEMAQLFKSLAHEAATLSRTPQINGRTGESGATPLSRAIPSVVLSQSPSNPCEFAMGVKGTTTSYEWWLDFNFWVSPDPLIGTTHRGVQDLTLAIWPVLREQLIKLSREHQCQCSKTRLLYYGHSLGGAVAGELAFRSAMDFSGRDLGYVVPVSPGRKVGHAADGDAGCDLRVDAVMFSPLKALQENTRRAFKSYVNARSLSDLNDPLTHLPCNAENSFHGYPRCPRTHAGFPGVGRDVHADHPGIVWLDVDYKRLLNWTHSHDDRFVTQLMNFLLPPSITEKLPQQSDFAAAHVCSFSCALSAGCQRPPTMTNWRWWCEDCITAT